MKLEQPENPWLMRTYSGHSTAKASNELYRTNLKRGQTGLSVAFDLPTQTGYDADHPLAAGEVGRVGVPVSHLGDMEALFADIPLERMNTSMTINATAPWLLALYVALAERRGIDRATLAGTTQNDILKEYLSRGTYAFPPAPSLKLSADVIAWSTRELPKWNPTNICSYHLQEAGATPAQEIALALSDAIAVLDEVRKQMPPAELPKAIGRVSFFVNAGMRFVEEMCKLRAFGRLWDEIARERYGVTDSKDRRFRYGVQVNSLGLTEAQPENNVPRIVLEMLGVTLSRDARARAIQLPAWNEALGLPRPWDQQWSLRAQQILACETDVLEYPDLFEGSKVVESLTASLVEAARAEMREVERAGGAVKAIESGWAKSRLVESLARLRRAIESGERKVVGVNCFTETAESPLRAGADGGILTVDPRAEAEQIAALKAFRASRDAARVTSALASLERDARSGGNIMPASIEAAKAGVTTGEWAGVMRTVFGDYRAPTGVGASAASLTGEAAKNVKAQADALARELGGRPKMLLGKPGLDGHSNGVEQIAVHARDAGFEVIYLGIRLTPDEIVKAAVQEAVDVVGLSILSGAHMSLVPAVQEGLRRAGLDVPIVVGGIIPDADARALVARGIAAVFTPKDFDRSTVLARVIEAVRARNHRSATHP
ncbi:MAG TPA: protein meaA [bacterium]|nr:protein meaA [bacterium]